MKSKKILAIWMDDTIAYLMESVNDKTITITIKSGKGHHRIEQKAMQGNIDTYFHSQSQEEDYFHKISDYIVDFDEVTLFGPVGSKNDLFNLLLLNPLFDTINLSIRDAGKMNNPERESFVRNNMISTGRTLSAFGKRENPHGSLESAGYFTSVVLN